SEEKGVKYMQAWEEKMYERLEGRKEGKAEGIKEGQKEGIIVGRAAGMLELLVDQLETLGSVPEEMKEKLSLEKDPARLKAWNKLAAGAASMEDFERKAGLS
ncbi:MAG: hypothetical protein Q4C82_04110, partial [Eubacteriales bacterium]|nr:hypothetical protein [Eubacteriales bacterium]